MKGRLNRKKGRTRRYSSKPNTRFHTTKKSEKKEGLGIEGGKIKNGQKVKPQTAKEGNGTFAFRLQILSPLQKSKT